MNEFEVQLLEHLGAIKIWLALLAGYAGLGLCGLFFGWWHKRDYPPSMS